jgi:hypothetical protein
MTYILIESLQARGWSAAQISSEIDGVDDVIRTTTDGWSDGELVGLQVVSMFFADIRGALEAGIAKGAETKGAIPLTLDNPREKVGKVESLVAQRIDDSLATMALLRERYTVLFDSLQRKGWTEAQLIEEGKRVYSALRMALSRYGATSVRLGLTKVFLQEAMLRQSQFPSDSSVSVNLTKPSERPQQLPVPMTPRHPCWVTAAAASSEESMAELASQGSIPRNFQAPHKAQDIDLGVPFPKVSRVEPLQGNERVEFAADGRAVLKGSPSLGLLGFIRQTAQVFRRDLKGEDKRIFEHWLCIPDGCWTQVHEDAFVRGFERFLYDGLTEEESFRAIRQALREEYPVPRGSAIDIAIPADVRCAYSRLLGGKVK